MMAGFNRDAGDADRREQQTPVPVMPLVEQLDFGPILRVLDMLETPEEREIRRRFEQAENADQKAQWQQIVAAREPGQNAVWKIQPVKPIPGDQAFIFAAHDLVQSGFDWPRYAHSSHTQALMAKLRAGDTSMLGLDDARKIMFCLARQNRFVDGAVRAAIDSGLIRLILERVQELTAQTGPYAP